MSMQKKARSAASAQKRIDESVIADADNDSAWETPDLVTRTDASFGLPAELAERARFLARLHHERSLQSWLERVVRERIEIEERAFSDARRILRGKPRT